MGDHRTACPTAGVLSPRGTPLERAAAQVCREAGARVASNVMLRDMNLDVPLADARRIELWPMAFPGTKARKALLTPISQVRSRGMALRARGQTGRPGRLPPELLAARRCWLVVIGLEVGGRMDTETVTFLRQLAAARAREAPARMRLAARRASIHRWTGMLVVAAQRAYAMSLLRVAAGGGGAWYG